MCATRLSTVDAAVASARPLSRDEAADTPAGTCTRPAPAATTDVAVVILTLNEEDNLPPALASVSGWAKEIFVVDSFSTDRTIEIARQAGCTVVQHTFVDHAKQRNFAIDSLPYTATWVLFLDADERLTDELKSEISGVLASSPAENGYYIKRRLYWMGRWIRRGYYPIWILRLFRRGAGRCEDRPVNEHIIVEGKVGCLQSDFIHEDRKGISDWIVKHNRYASLEAAELLRNDDGAAQAEIAVKFFGAQAERKRWIRYRIWNRLPVLVRPFLYFFYRLVIRGGFLDGSTAIAYHFLQALWFPLLVDLKYLELRRHRSSGLGAIEWHEAHAQRFNDRYQSSPRFRERLRVWSTVLSTKLSGNETIIDIGCGPGMITEIAAGHVERVVAADGSASMIRLAQARVERAGLSNVEFVTGRVESGMALPVSMADALICSSVVEYIDDQERFFGAWARIVRPGGTLFISVPNGRCWYRHLEAAAFRVFGRPRYYANVKYVETLERWRERLSRHGFQVQEVL